MQNALHFMIRASASRRFASRPACRSSSTRVIRDEPWRAADRLETSGSKQDWCGPVSQNDTRRSQQGEGEDSGEVCTKGVVTFFGMKFLVVENNLEKRTVDVQCIARLIINEPQFPELVHEKAHPRASCAHHRSEEHTSELQS